MPRVVTADGVAFIQQQEGCRLTAYADAGRGVLTIGYGHTGDDVTEGLTITQAQADELFAQDIQKFAGGVDAEIGQAVTTTGQFDAMVSLAYNIGDAEGVEGFDTSTVLREHIAGNYAAAAEAFALWNKAGGQVLEGLVNRRAAEAAMYSAASP